MLQSPIVTSLSIVAILSSGVAAAATGGSATCNTTATNGLEVRHAYQGEDLPQSYRLYVPTDLPISSVPMVVVLPNSAGTLVDTSSLEKNSEVRKFVLVVPRDEAAIDTQDGTGYLADIINDVSSNYCIDEHRVWTIDQAKFLDFLDLSATTSLAKASVQPVEFEWLTVDNPGNAADITTGFGAVEKTFLLAKYEVTNQQYSQFLNAKAASDPLNLYSPTMGAGAGGITRSGVPGSFTYAPIEGREERPVNWVSYYDVLRFTNWMHNGQGDGDTETGAYTLEGGGPVPTNAETVRRNPDARIFLPTEDEWYKAAYHNANGLEETDYFLHPFRTDVEPTCSVPTDGDNHANCARAVTDVVPRGSYPNSISPYGTLDQGGNVWEWNVGFVRGVLPVMRGGGYYIGPNTLASSWRDQWTANGEFSFAGFRVAAADPSAIELDLKSATGGGAVAPISLLILGLLLVFRQSRQRRVA